MREPRKSIISGLIWCLFCCALYFNAISKNLKEYKLIKNSQTTTGQTSKCYGSAEDDEGKTIAEDTCFYTFTVNDQVFEGMTHEEDKEFAQIEIEYLVKNPEVNRLKGEGGTTISNWIWQRILGKTVILALLLIPGILLIRNGLRESKAPIINKVTPNSPL